MIVSQRNLAHSMQSSLNFRKVIELRNAQKQSSATN